MNSIPPGLRKQLSEDPYYRECARKGSDCAGRITWEHAIIYAGKQVQERWAIIPLCYHHHLGAGLVKRINIQIAMRRAGPDDQRKYPRLKW